MWKPRNFPMTKPSGSGNRNTHVRSSWVGACGFSRAHARNHPRERKRERDSRQSCGRVFVEWTRDRGARLIVATAFCATARPPMARYW
jgi:hypothetical protein